MQDDIRTTHIINTILGLTREAIGEKLAAAEQAAADSAEDADKDDGKPIMAKLTISLKWQAGAAEPVIDLKAGYAVNRSSTYTAKADGIKIDLEGTA